jgi:hypothetical protein
MKRTLKLNERDLSRIIKRVINEGAGFSTYYTSSDGIKIEVFCTQGNGGLNSKINRDGKGANLTQAQFALLCPGMAS